MQGSEKPSARTLAGKCLCGAVHYTVADEFLYAANCYCSQCRRATGAAFKPFVGIEREKLAITEGEGELMTFGDDSAHDARCRRCGSFLYSVVRDGAFVHVAMGSLVDEPSLSAMGDVSLTVPERSPSATPPPATACLSAPSPCSSHTAAKLARTASTRTRRPPAPIARVGL